MMEVPRHINSDIAASFNLQGGIQKTQVNMLNGSIETFETTPVQFHLQSINGQVKTIEVFTINKVTGDLKVTNWKVLNKNLNHLKKKFSND